MRDIRCRGREIDNGEWIYGYLVVYPNGSESCEFKTHFIINEKRNSYAETVECENTYCVFPSTVGQYTGLKGKNCVGIYEHDIVVFTYGKCYHEKNGLIRIGTVVYDKKTAAFKILIKDSKFLVGFYDISKIEIIGNIHDNPELLGVK